MTGNDNATTGSGPAQSVSGNGNAVSQTGNATSTTNTATANGPGGTAQAAGTINNNNVKASDLDWAKLKDLDNADSGAAWKSDDRGEYIEVPSMPNRGTKITPPLSTAPFAGHNRKAVVEMKNVSMAWQERFAFQAKAMQPFGDEDRQPGTAKAGQTFTILQTQKDDRNYYLAWRGSVDQSERLTFAADNENAIIVIRLLK